MSQATLSELSNVEVTHDEFQLLANQNEPAQVRPVKPFRLSSILSATNLHLRPRRSPQRREADVSVSTEFATTQSVDDGLDGQQSVANFTIGSNDTVKASNRKALDVEPSNAEPAKKPKKTWTKIKRFMGVKQETSKQDSDEIAEARNQFSRNRTHSAGHVTPTRSNPKTYPLDNRTGSDPRHRKSKSPETPRRNNPASKEQAHLDQAIRGRLDGMDVMSLGSARQFSSSPDPIPPPPNDDDILMHPFTGVSNKYSPRQMIFDMIWYSGGKSPPELVFEGFLPGGEDRWKVILDTPRSSFFTSHGDSNSSTATQNSDVKESPVDDGSTFIPLDKLWRNMWGPEHPPPAPSHMSPTSGKDDVLQLASACSVPIDLDEDTFIIETAMHLQSVHDIASISIRVRLSYIKVSLESQASNLTNFFLKNIFTVRSFGRGIEHLQQSAPWIGIET
jgi:hypothetical protein